MKINAKHIDQESKFCSENSQMKIIVQSFFFYFANYIFIFENNKKILKDDNRRVHSFLNDFTAGSGGSGTSKSSRNFSCLIE